MISPKKLIDTHCHVFPDKIVNHAVERMESISGYKAEFPCSLKGVLKQQQQWGCSRFVMLDIATSPTSTVKVNDFLISCNNNDDIIAFGSIHPDYPDYISELNRLEAKSIKGIKFHSGFQEFAVDEKRMLGLYEAIAQRNMVLLFHGGYDPGFIGFDGASPKRFKNILPMLRGAKIIIAHMGDYLGDPDVKSCLWGEDVYFDISFGYKYLGREYCENMIKQHGADKFLYATDSPWTSGLETAAMIDSMDLRDEEKEQIFYKNAEKLLNLDD